MLLKRKDLDVHRLGLVAARFPGHTLRLLHALKPVVDPVTEPALAGLLREFRDGMRHFFPLGMHPENIGSNCGLLLLLKDLFGQQVRPGHYSFLSVDCNILMRMLKVLAVFQN